MYDTYYIDIAASTIVHDMLACNSNHKKFDIIIVQHKDEIEVKKKKKSAS